MISMTDPVAIGVETRKIDSVSSLEEEFTILIYMNPWMVIIPKMSIKFIHVIVVYVVL